MKWSYIKNTSAVLSDKIDKFHTMNIDLGGQVLVVPIHINTVIDGWTFLLQGGAGRGGRLPCSGVGCDERAPE